MKNLERKVNLLANIILSTDAEGTATLKEELRKIMKDARVSPTPRSTKRITQDIFEELGVPCQVDGYDYLVSAVCFMADDPSYRHQIFKRLYPDITKVSAVPTRPTRVERAMRYAIETTWSIADLDVLNKYFGNSVYPSKGKPTNSQFISRIAREVVRILEEESGAE